MADMADTADLMANTLARYRREADTSEPRRLEICPRRIGKISKLEQRLLGRRWAWQLFVLPFSENRVSGYERCRGGAHFMRGFYNCGAF
jgi:hypothetical protein